MFCVLLGPGSSGSSGDIPQQETRKLEGCICFSPAQNRSQTGVGVRRRGFENIANAGSVLAPPAGPQGLIPALP